jgi:hypothetical protein
VTTTEQRIELSLRTLGDSTEEIAGNLLRLRATGERTQPDSCPIATFLHDQGFDAPTVGSMFIRAREASGEVMVPTAPEIGDFIVAFDRGQYPALIRGES